MLTYLVVCIAEYFFLKNSKMGLAKNISQNNLFASFSYSLNPFTFLKSNEYLICHFPFERKNSDKLNRVEVAIP